MLIDLESSTRGAWSARPDRMVTVATLAATTGHRQLDRPGLGGGLDLPRRMESCLHRGSIPMRFVSEL